MEKFPHVKSTALVKVEKIGRGSFNNVHGITMPYVPLDSDTIRVLKPGEDMGRYVIRIPLK